jgi:hypothetical protein
VSARMVMTERLRKGARTVEFRSKIAMLNQIYMLNSNPKCIR